MALTKGVRVYIDRSPVADLKRPFNNRMRVDKQASGAIELAFLRGFQAGVESVKPMALTETDRKVLHWMANLMSTVGGFATPAEIGQAMGGTVSGKAQGLGRMGSRKAKRLREMGLIEDGSAMRGGFPAYRITALGQQVEQNLRLANG